MSLTFTDRLLLERLIRDGVDNFSSVTPGIEHEFLIKNIALAKKLGLRQDFIDELNDKMI